LFKYDAEFTTRKGKLIPPLFATPIQYLTFRNLLVIFFLKVGVEH